MNPAKPIIGITMGDPQGIGPEIILKALASDRIRCRAVVFGDDGHLRRVQKSILKKDPAHRLRFERTDFNRISDPTFWGGRKRIIVADFRNVHEFPLKKPRPTGWGGRASGQYIEAAVRAAQSRVVDAIVTAPINKLSFQMGGWGKRYVGHTEMVAALTNTKSYALMMVQGTFRTVYVTSHIPLAEVSRRLTKRRVEEVIVLADRALKAQGIRCPRIGVCGLNPHAGDGGVLGDEEQVIISPAIRACLRKGIDVQGPFAADALWPRVLSTELDLGIAMYHDQGQIPLKILSVRRDKKGRTECEGVNITLGTPIIRTSVAHGTAYDIAGRGIASEESLIQAIEMAARLAKAKR